MAFSVVMPALEMAQETGKLVAWRKREGESVAKGEPLLEVETDKAVLEVESPADGVLAGISATEGAVIPVGKTIAWIVRPGEALPQEVTPTGPQARSVNEPVRPVPAVPDLPPAQPASGARISPKARRLAQERGIDIAKLRGSGPTGEILASDVLGAEPSAPTRVEIEPPGPIARLMAERTTQSWTTVPHFFVSREVPAGALLAAREHLAAAIERSNQVKLTVTDILIASVARTLLKHPRMNASWDRDKTRLNSDINIGIAMAVEDGVVAPVIADTDSKRLGEIAAQRHDLAQRSRVARLRPSDLAHPTFTISNLGMYQVDAFIAIINAPQAAILAVGSIQDRVVAVNGHPGVRPMMTLSLSCDHRVVDGAKAALFLNDLVEALREPENWLR